MTEKPVWANFITKATEVETIKSALLLGGAGAGKSVLAASTSKVPELSPTLLIDVEGSATGIGRLYPEVDVISADSYNKLTSIVTDILNSEDNFGYKTVIIDTLTAAFRYAKKHFEEVNPSNGYKTWSDLEAWTNTLMSSLHQKKGLFAIFIGHTDDKKDESTGIITTSIKLQGASAQLAPTIPDLVGYLKFSDIDGTTHRVLIDGDSPRYETKNRFGLPGLIVDPTFEKIYEAITKEKEE